MDQELAWAMLDAELLNDLVCSWLILERLQGNRSKRSLQIESLALTFRETWKEAEYKMQVCRQPNQRRLRPLRSLLRIEFGDITSRLRRQIHIMSRVLIDHEDPVLVKLTL